MPVVRKLWKYSLLITVPISVLFLMWATRTYSLYIADSAHFSLSPHAALQKIGKLNFYYLVDYFRDATIGNTGSADINLYIDDAMLYELNRDLPYSGLGGDNFKTAYMVYPDEQLERIQLRYRGDSSNHWLFKEKSYRIKTRKKRLYENIRRFNLIVHESPDLLSPHASYELANIVGLSGPRSELVTVNVNGKSEGAKLMVEQIDESFLRRRGMMPGDIYNGDNGRSDKYWGLDESLFKSSLNWSKAAANNHYDLESKVPLENMLMRLKEGDYSPLDLAQFGKFAAYIDLTRTRHHDESHNWKLHYDHYLERFAPLVWDGLGWSEFYVSDEHRSGIVNTSFMAALYRNHDFLYERQKALINFYRHDLDDFLAFLDAAADTAKEKANAKFYFVDVFNNVYSRGEVVQAITAFKETVRSVLEEVKAATVALEGAFSYSLLNDGVRLQIAQVPVSSIRIFLNPQADPGSVTVRFDADGKTIERDVTAVSHREGDSLVLDQRLFPTSVIADENHTFDTATFDISIAGVDASDIRAVNVTPMTLTAHEIEATPLDRLVKREFRGEVQIVPQARESEPITLSGEVVLTGFQEITSDLVIAPGTRVMLTEGAGLRALGQVTAIGTVEAPIVFTTENRLVPWGAIAIKDPGADGSRLEHCVFEYGSGIKEDTFEYTAMLSIHNASDILIKNCVFRENRLTDDMLHVVYSDVRIENTLFENALSDAVDLDITEADIKDCQFIGSGNDAVDLMTSKAVISGSIMSHSSDKGVSIGENSLLFTVDSIFSANNIGLESKDASHALVMNSLIEKNAIGAHAYQKNWQYGAGGSLVIGNSIIEKNNETASVGKKSEVTIFDSYMDRAPKPEKGLFLVNSDSAFRLEAQGSGNLKGEILENFFARHLPLANNNIRGVFADSRNE
ncbi:MAG: CotH kinase family protein [Halioglobus sp.]|nr:CotH kinase family protein [Halioglobus sp.]